MTPYHLREAEPDERKLAYSTWWQQMADLRPPQTPMGLWRRGCQENVARVLRLSDILVAAANDEPTDVLGLVCFGATPTLLHFVYVKFHVRTWGIARRLLERAVNGGQPEAVKFTTMPRRRFMGIVQPEWRFDPFAGTRLHFGTGPFQETKQ